MPAKLRIVFWLGVLTLFVPFLGITNGIRTTLTIIIGALIIWLALRLRKQYKEFKYRMRKYEESPIAPEITTQA